MTTAIAENGNEEGVCSVEMHEDEEQVTEGNEEESAASSSAGGKITVRCRQSVAALPGL